MTRFQHACLLLSWLLPPAMASDAMAQGFSIDGNRWYEIEVSIFSNEGPEVSNELVIPEKTDLTYQQPLRQLEPAASSFLIDFDEPDDNLVNTSAVGQAGFSLIQAREPLMIGPETTPPAGDFRLTDFSRDPFIALGNEEAEFTAYNRDLERSPDHRLLFHAVWRQPVLNRMQSGAIVVSGGDQFGKHHELEGSLRFSYNINRVDIEVRVWLADFSALANTTTNTISWQLPEQPFPGGDSTLTMDLPVTRLAYMDQLRQMVSNELYYLDHPAIGLLVQIRPYTLPEPVGFSFE